VGFDGRFADFVRLRVDDAWRRELDVLTACNEWYSGAFLLETVPSVLYILMRHADDPEEAFVRAVNDTKDNDTVAAIVGAAVGALHGSSAFPARWRDGLPGRTRDDDDGRVFQLIEGAQPFRPPAWRWTPA
jgi:ADP-ribosylglycohydrolase